MWGMTGLRVPYLSPGHKDANQGVFISPSSFHWLVQKSSKVTWAVFGTADYRKQKEASLYLCIYTLWYIFNKKEINKE